MSEQGTQPIQVSDNTEKTESNEGRGHGRRRHRRSGGGGSHQTRHASAEPAINMDELRNLVELISASGFTEFEYEREDIRVRLRKELPAQVVAAPIGQTPSVQTQSASLPTPLSPTVISTPTSQTVSAPAVSVPHPGAHAEAEAAADDDLHKIVSPIIGTFYRSPSPEAAVFVKIGSHVGKDTVVCIVEAMKLMNEIQAEVSGEIVKIYVENGQPVEYGQPLFGIKK